jgi:hypothetical protein
MKHSNASLAWEVQSFQRAEFFGNLPLGGRLKRPKIAAVSAMVATSRPTDCVERHLFDEHRLIAGELLIALNDGRL